MFMCVVNLKSVNKLDLTWKQSFLIKCITKVAGKVSFENLIELTTLVFHSRLVSTVSNVFTSAMKVLKLSAGNMVIWYRSYETHFLSVTFRTRIFGPWISFQLSLIFVGRTSVHSRKEITRCVCEVVSALWHFVKAQEKFYKRKGTKYRIDGN